MSWVFLRKNLGAQYGDPPSRLSEREARVYLGVCVRSVERAVERLKKGEVVTTRYASYTAQEA